MDAYKIIAKELERLIKAKIKELSLYKSGKMYNSINVSAVNSGFKVFAVDYFEFQNKKYNIVGSVVKSPEFSKFMAKAITSTIIDKINKTQ